MTIDGTDDHKIRPQGAEGRGYSFEEGNEGTTHFKSTARALEVEENKSDDSSDVGNDVCAFDSDSDCDDENMDDGSAAESIRE